MGRNPDITARGCRIAGLMGLWGELLMMVVGLLLELLQLLGCLGNCLLNLRTERRERLRNA